MSSLLSVDNSCNGLLPCYVVVDVYEPHLDAHNLYEGISIATALLPHLLEALKVFYSLLLCGLPSLLVEIRTRNVK